MKSNTVTLDVTWDWKINRIPFKGVKSGVESGVESGVKSGVESGCLYLDLFLL